MIRAFIIVAASTALMLPRSEQAPACDTPLTEAAIKQLVAGKVPAARVRSLIATCGIDLNQPDAAATESRLKQIGVGAAALTSLAPPAKAASGVTWTSPHDRRVMVTVPAGSFRMGSDPGEPNHDPDEAAHDVTIAAPYWVDVDEVSNEAYRRFVISRPEWQKGNIKPGLHDGNYLKDWNGTNYPEGRGDWPVTSVSWHAARAYAAWAGRRLPTEAEWEYAARAGTANRFWWGAIYDAARVVTDPKAPPPAERRTNPWGIRDTAGSVWEWTSSLFRQYPYVASDGREDPAATTARATRGGSRANGQAFLRVANRSMEDPTFTSDLLGFRCVR